MSGSWFLFAERVGKIVKSEGREICTNNDEKEHRGMRGCLSERVRSGGIPKETAASCVEMVTQAETAGGKRGRRLLVNEWLGQW